MFSELLEEVIDGGHRLLVFSQFVGMLTLLKEKLTAESIEFCYLDGSTTDRGAVVEKFQTNPAIPVFLISLKAGGVGLNLTGADTVIHLIRGGIRRWKIRRRIARIASGRRKL
ncbi:MAG: C-terminal helicase domain-containing protein [Limisphaerales bacterium]